MGSFSGSKRVFLASIQVLERAIAIKQSSRVLRCSAEIRIGLLPAPLDRFILPQLNKFLIKFNQNNAWDQKYPSSL